MKIRVQGDHHAVFERRSAQNLLVGGLGQADFPRVDRIEPRLPQERRAGAGRALVEEQLHLAAASSSTLSSRFAAA